MKSTIRKKLVGNRKNRRGAVALEYILIATLIASAIIGAFVYFRDSLRSNSDQMVKAVETVLTENIGKIGSSSSNSGNNNDGNGGETPDP